LTSKILYKTLKKKLARNNNSFLGLEVAMPTENFNDVESIDSDGDGFERFQPSNKDVDQF